VGRKTAAALKRALRGTSANENGGFDPDKPATKNRSLGDRIPVKKGMSGHDIRVLQDFLSRAGFTTKIDGEVGSGTHQAGKLFQAQKAFRVDGAVDAPDIDALRAAVARGAPAAGAQPTQPTQLAPGDTAQIGPDGLAIAPASAPDQVKAIIAAGNVIAKTPYKY